MAMHIYEMLVTLPNFKKMLQNIYLVHFLRQKALLKSTECVNLHVACAKFAYNVHNSCSCSE